MPKRDGSGGKMQKRAASSPFPSMQSWPVLASWPRLNLRAVVEAPLGERRSPPTPQHHVVLFSSDVTVSVRSVGLAGWRVLRLIRGDVVLRPAGLPAQDNRWQAADPVRLVHLVIDSAYLPVTPHYILAPNTIYKLRDPMLGMLIERLHRAAIQRLHGTQRVVSAASELFCLLVAESLADAEPATGPGALTAPALRRVCAHIDERLEHPLRLGELAELAGLSPSHFVRAFNASTNVTPVRFVQNRRLLRAQELLRSTDKSLVEIAHATGFGSQSRFTTAFGAAVGQSPARYRKAHLR